MDVHALIPVRGGSQRVIHKNIRPFAGSTLLEIKIKQMLQVPSLSGVTVSSEDEKILEIAERAGAAPMLRDPFYATDSVPMSEVYAYMAGQIKCENILLTHVTNPLAGPSAYTTCLKEFHNRAPIFDSVTTVADVKEFMYWDGKPLNYDPASKPRSQDLPNIVRLTHVASILPRETMITRKDAVGSHPLFVRLDALDSLDIDTSLDLEIAEYLYQAYRKPTAS